LSNSDPVVKSRAAYVRLGLMDNAPAPWRARLGAAGVDVMVILGWLGSLAVLSRIPMLRRSGYAQLSRRGSTADLAQTATGVFPAALHLAVGKAEAAHAGCAGLRERGQLAGARAPHMRVGGPRFGALKIAGTTLVGGLVESTTP
jgi:hypothetical protein